MSRSLDDTPQIEQMQQATLESDLWNTEVVPRLPRELASQACSLKAFVRVREVKSASDLLRALLAYVLCAPSFQRVGAWAVLIGLAELSDSAWSKRLLKASAWLLWLLGELLAVPAPASWLHDRARSRVLLVDATRLRQPGGCGDDWRVHSGYDLLAGRLSEVTVTDQHTGESLAHFHLQPTDIVVADNGYGYRSNVAIVVKQQADAVLRITPSTFPLEDRQGREVDVLRWLHSKGKSVRSKVCWCRWKGKRYRVRLIARHLPPEVAEAARQRKIQRAKDKGKEVTEEMLFLAGWVLLITTLPQQEWSDAQVLQLYRARWQAELVYKRMKQLLRLNQIRSTTAAGAQATVRALLVVWALQEEEASQVREQLGQAQAELEAQTQTEFPAVSSWVLTGLCLETLRLQVQGQWSAARLHACVPRLRRFLCSHRCRRVHQETAMRAWLASPTRRLPTALQRTG